MNEQRIIKNEKIIINDNNYYKMYVLQASAIATLKVIDFLQKESQLRMNPIEIIKQEFISKFDFEDINDTLLYDVSLACMVTACKYLDTELKVNKNNLLDIKSN